MGGAVNKNSSFSIYIFLFLNTFYYSAPFTFTCEPLPKKSGFLGRGYERIIDDTALY